MKNFFLITLLLILTILQSCTREPFHDERSGSKGKINIQLSTRDLKLSGASVSEVRIIAYHKGDKKIKLNTTSLTDQSTESDKGSYFFSIPLGSYSFYAIVNEPANLTAQLDAVDSEEALNLIKIQPEDPFTETTVMLVKKVDAVIAIDANEKTTVDGSTDPLSIELERAYTKVSLKINKNTNVPGDEFVIEKVDFVQSPVYSYLNAKVYDGSLTVSRELFSGSEKFTTNGTEAVIVKESPAGTAGEPSNIFAEYLLSASDAGNHNKASYLGILAKYTPAGGSAHEVYYKIPVGDYGTTDNTIGGAGHNYNLKRNHHYAINAQITQIGSKDAVEINYTVEPWTGEGLDIEIDGDPFLDVSNVEVDVYDAAVTRIYFYSNMPDVVIAPMLLNGTQLSPVNETFESLTGLAPKNFTYSYNTTTQRGEGYFDLINTQTDNSVRQQRKLYLRSGKLVREITATTRISTEAAKENQQPFVGTFHRYTERGERIVSWHLPTTTKWRVEVVTDNLIDGEAAGDYSHAGFLRIDRFASPNHAKLYTLEPPNAEGAFVMEEMVGDQKTLITKIEGQGRVYFRVGWSEVLTKATDHRFAKIKVTTSTDDFVSDKKESYLYCRQGEAPKAIVALATVFASYNISTPETFVDFPTQSGYLYQWNRTVPLAVTGAANSSYPKGDETDVSINNGYEYKVYENTTYICPAKYSYPDNDALTVMNTALDPQNVMYQWGYYADGFFDRRAVSNHIVRNALGEIASAGGLFYSRSTAVAIFLPTVSWRNYNGDINSTTDHQKLGVIGHYWSKAQKGEWPTGSSVTAATLEAWALHLTTEAKPASYLEEFNKASAASVRCMQLEGKTVSFDANGGLTTPRSMTVKEGDEVTFPPGPQHSNSIFGFTNWASTRGGGLPTYDAGAKKNIDELGDKTVYAQYKRMGYLINGAIMLISDEVLNKTWAEANTHCTTALTPIGSWRLPAPEELRDLWLLNKALLPNLFYWTSKAGAVTGKHVLIVPSMLPNTLNHEDSDIKPYNVRCVRVLP